jgi:competence protein ComEC
VKRPLLISAAAFAAGIYCAHSAWFPAWLLSLFAGTLVGCGMVFISSRTGRRGLLLVCVLFALGALYWQARNVGPPGDSLHRQVVNEGDGGYTLEGVVRSSFLYLAGEEYGVFVLEADAVRKEEQPLPLSGGVLVRWSDPDHGVHPGERIQLAGHLSPRLSAVNHGVSSQEDRLRQQGVYTEMRCKGAVVQHLERNVWNPAYWASRLRTWQSKKFERYVHKDALPYVLAVWLGERSRLNRDLYDSFLLSGTAHILSVSGVHMGVVFMSLSVLFRMLMRPGRWQSLLIMFAVFFFAFAAGARLASLRAACMIAVYLMAGVLNREPDAPTALGLSGFLLLLSNPDNLFDGGFLLSFASVSSLLIFADPLAHHLTRLPLPARGAVATPLAVQIVPFPLAIHTFHVMPILGPLVNLVVVPLLAVTLWLCFLTILSAVALPPAAMLFGHALLPVVWLIENIARTVASLPGGHILLPSPMPLALCFYAAAVVALYFGLAIDKQPVTNYSILAPKNMGWRRVYFLQMPPRKRWRAAASLLLLFAVELWQWWPMPPEVSIVDVGRCDAIFIRTPNDARILLDGGLRNDYVNDGKRTVLPFLLSNGASKLDVVINSHPDQDHLGGLMSVMDRMPVGLALLGPTPSDKKLEQEFLALCARKNVPVQRIVAGQTVELGGAKFDILYPKPKTGGKVTNNDSLVMRLSWPGFSMLLPGDIEKQGERQVAKEDCQADFLKVPHHGSATSSSEAFLDAVQPSAALISTLSSRRINAVGRGVIERYEERGIPIWRTDFHGGIRLRPGEGGVEILGARSARGYSLEPGKVEP